jgi:hypothetical protein
LDVFLPLCPVKEGFQRTDIHLYRCTGEGSVGTRFFRLLLEVEDKPLDAVFVQISSCLSDRRITLASPEIVRAYVEDLHNILGNSTLAERKTFIRSFIKEVKVTEDQVLLTYTIPLSTEGISEEKVGVLSTVQYGGRYCTIGRTFELAFSLAT